MLIPSDDAELMAGLGIEFPEHVLNRGRDAKAASMIICAAREVQTEWFRIGGIDD